MNRFEQVKQILDLAVEGQNFAAHGAFWRGTTRDGFVSQVVFGQTLLVVGDGNSSNLVKALRGEAPFGQDIGTSGAFFRRMPAGFPAVSDDQIEFIRQWIDDGCPVDEEASDSEVDRDAGQPADPQLHLDFWRDFDNRFLFQATPEVRGAVNDYFGVGSVWLEFAKDPSRLDDWLEGIRQPRAKQSIQLLAGLQRETVRNHYGAPVPLITLLDSFERFGDDSLPDDPLRPEDRRHNMNGSIMWFFWSAFADACLRLEIEPEFWTSLGGGIILGAMNDGLFRGRFQVEGFSADSQGKAEMRQHVRSLEGKDEVLQELSARFVDSGL